ncbi:hypothetical protein NC652_001811 [Populus alba x Populus x berolinensis]|uniref:Uncharacterized protein n=1 Tax=Populus alba x Populus x berolinensis TaxID=444605 RepID=A0AAD6RP82_9ROSI|nr:hypothetical protein NC652_001811 [Populus alba x Populus x berolinensis]KAJ7011562.1 hypothetical protein NC653_001861 [Populus alba x Populus x berolinensis]
MAIGHAIYGTSSTGRSWILSLFWHPDGDLVVPNGYQPETLQLVFVGPGSDEMDVKLFHVSGGPCKCMQSDCCGLQSCSRERDQVLSFYCIISLVRN